MEDFQFWLYVILGVVYLLSQVRKKSKTGSEIPGAPKTPKQTSTRKTATQTYTSEKPAAPKTMTFEELLREISESKQKQSVPEEKYDYPEYTSYEEEEFEEEYKEEIEPVKKETVYDQFNKAKYKDYTSTSLEENLKLEDVKVEFGKFKVFEQNKEENLLDLYAGDLWNMHGLKKAFVLSEIIKPKYF